MNCFYCLVNDDSLVPAVTSIDGTTLCKSHAETQARLLIEQEKNDTEHDERIHSALSRFRR